jgi:hypothetical protein
MLVHKQVGDLIDGYNIQYYNQGSDYSTCQTLVTKSRDFPGTSVVELMNNGIPANKIIIGKPATAKDADNGFMEASELAKCGQLAQNHGWSEFNSSLSDFLLITEFSCVSSAGGWMTWEYPNGDTKWINTVNPDASKSGPPVLGNSASTASVPAALEPTSTDTDSVPLSPSASSDGSQGSNELQESKKKHTPSDCDGGASCSSSSSTSTSTFETPSSTSDSGSKSSAQEFSDGLYVLYIFTPICR